MTTKKTKNYYHCKAAERILRLLEEKHFASNTMIVHQLSELSSEKINPHIVTEVLYKLTKEKIISKKEKPFKNQVKILCYTYERSKKFKPELVEKRKKEISPYLDKLKNNKNPEQKNQ